MGIFVKVEIGMTRGSIVFCKVSNGRMMTGPADRLPDEDKDWDS